MAQVKVAVMERDPGWCCGGLSPKIRDVSSFNLSVLVQHGVPGDGGRDHLMISDIFGWPGHAGPRPLARPLPLRLLLHTICT